MRAQLKTWGNRHGAVTLLGPVGAEIGINRSDCPPRNGSSSRPCCCARGRWCRPKALSQALWDTAPPGSAATPSRAHQAAAPAARTGIGPDRHRRPGYLIEVGPTSSTSTVRRAPLAAEAIGWRVGERGPSAARGAGVWQGEPLSDVPSACLRRTEVQRLTELRFDALEARLDVELRAGVTTRSSWNYAAWSGSTRSVSGCGSSSCSRRPRPAP